MTKEEIKIFQQYINSTIKQEIANLVLSYRDPMSAHAFEIGYMQTQNGGSALDQALFRLYLRKVVPVVAKEMGKEGAVLVWDEHLGGGKWDTTLPDRIKKTKDYLLDFINESILTAKIGWDADGNIAEGIDLTKPEELEGRLLYNQQDGNFYQYRETDKGEIVPSLVTYIRDNQIVFIENQPTMRETIFVVKDGALVSFLATAEQDGLLSKEDKEKLDTFDLSGYIKNIKINGIDLAKNDDSEVEIPIATNDAVGLVKAGENVTITEGAVNVATATADSLGVVKGGENVTIGADGSINVDIPVSIDEVVNLHSITTAPAQGEEGQKYYNATDKKIYTYVGGVWTNAENPQTSKVYFFEDGATIHQYRSDGVVLIEIIDSLGFASKVTHGIVKVGDGIDVTNDGVISVTIPDVRKASNTEFGIVRGGENVNIVDGVINVALPDAPHVEPIEYDVANTTTLGLVMASNNNATADAIATDGNVQVSGSGKMRVRKLMDKTTIAGNEYGFVVDPDTNIENLRRASWSETSEVLMPLNDVSISAAYIHNPTEEALIGEVFQNIKVGGRLTATIANNTPNKVRGSVVYIRNMTFNCVSGRSYTETTHTNTYNVQVRIKSAQGDVLYEGGNGTLDIAEVTQDMLPLGVYVIGAEPTQSTRKSHGCYTFTPKSQPFDLSDIILNTNVTISDVMINGERATESKEVHTTIGGHNVALGKNGLLVQSASDEKYVKVLEDGTIEHNFGATQNTGQANVLEQVCVNGEPLEIVNKSVNVELPEVGGEQIERNTIYAITNGTETLYTTQSINMATEGFPLYADKDLTRKVADTFTPIGSGNIQVAGYTGIFHASETIEGYVKSGVLATEQAVVAEVEKAMENVAKQEVIAWGENSNLNNYKEQGIYHFAGYRKNLNDNLPIANVDTTDKCNVAFTLIVDRKDGYYEGSTSIPDVVSQTLFLGNRQGSETKIYTRHYQYLHHSQTERWEDWKEMLSTTSLGLCDSLTEAKLNSATENGLYMGYVFNGATPAESCVFKLEVINNYALAAVGGVPASLVQTATIVGIDGKNKTLTRKASYQGNAWVFGEWEEPTSGGATTTKYKVGDVVMYKHNANSSMHTSLDWNKVVKWEDWVANPSAYRDNTNEFPIGLVVDPVKRIFVFCQTLSGTIFDLDAVQSMLGGYLSMTDGAETFKRIGSTAGADTRYFPAFYEIRNKWHGDTSSVNPFYVNNANAFVPSLGEWEKAWDLLALDSPVTERKMEKLIQYRMYGNTTPTEERFITNASAFNTAVSSIGCVNSNTLGWFNAVGSVMYARDVQQYPVFGLYVED